MKYTHLVNDTFLDEVCSFKLAGPYDWDPVKYYYTNLSFNQQGNLTDLEYVPLTAAAIR